MNLTWIDYLTGLTTALSSKKNRFGIRTVLDKIEIKKDNENYKTYSEFIKKLAIRHHADKIIDLDLLESAPWSKEHNDFMSYSKIIWLSQDSTEKTFRIFRQILKTRSFR